MMSSTNHYVSNPLPAVQPLPTSQSTWNARGSFTAHQCKFDFSSCDMLPYLMTGPQDTQAGLARCLAAALRTFMAQHLLLLPWKLQRTAAKGADAGRLYSSQDPEHVVRHTDTCMQYRFVHHMQVTAGCDRQDETGWFAITLPLEQARCQKSLSDKVLQRQPLHASLWA